MSEESVLLIFPSSAWGEIERFCQPLGILWLASMLKQEGIDVTAVDLSAEGWYPRKLAQFISQGNFTHVGATILTPFRHVPYFIFQLAKKINPEITTIAGGPHVTYVNEGVFSECSAIDMAVSGEAELKIAEIVRSPSKKFYDLGYVKDVDSIPIPDRSFVRHIKYDRMASLWIGDSASMKWVRGCPWRKCRFCSRSVLTRAHRPRSPEKIIEEIAILQNELKYKNIIIADDSLKINSKYTKKILRMKIKEGLDIPFWSLARVDHIDEEGARLMRRAGAAGIQFGLESVVPRMIDMYRKTNKDPKHWRQILDKAFDLSDKYQMIAIASFIIGGPSETPDEVWATLRYCRSSKLDVAQPFPFLYLIGTEFWSEAVEKGQINPNQLYTYNDKAYGTTEYTTDELFDLAVKANNFINSPLLNPGRTFRIIRKIIKQGNIQLLGQNVLRLPKILTMLREQTYETVPEELHA